MKLILDLDDVILDTRHLKEQMFVSFEQRGIDKEVAEGLYKEYRRTGIPFSLRTFLTMVANKTGHEGLREQDCYEEIMSICTSIIHQDVLALIKDVGRENVYIVTHGDEEFQKDKIRRSLGENYVAGVFVVNGSKKDVIAELCLRFQSQTVIFSDDKEAFLEDIDMEVCKNLKKVPFKEGSADMLLAEVARVQQEEKSKEVQKQTDEQMKGSGPKMG